MQQRCGTCDAGAGLDLGQHLDFVEECLDETAHLIVGLYPTGDRAKILGLVAKYMGLLAHQEVLYRQG